MARQYNSRYRQQQPDDPEMIDSRSPAARRAGLRNAQFDIWGNLIKGSYAEDGMLADGGTVRKGDVWERQKPGMTGIDRYKAGLHTPNLNRWQRNNPDERTAWGQTRSNARKWAAEQDRLRMEQPYRGPRVSDEVSAMRQQALQDIPNAEHWDPSWYTAWGRKRHANKVTSAPYEGSFR